ncbi:(2Fe-2S)-binding protein [Nocardioides sp. LHD-245]|uniref:(2Fe-2S)-binding protein n=1 Tax=Nocardioides sp. LHD-245 TaxID=3051387 RepID=UPI0027DF907A|nr:(2Fe-2S)-binding protein [Nocardioides sp. LHD-245]
MTTAAIHEGSMPVTITVNGRTEKAEVPGLTPLGDFLREKLGLTGTKLGCRAGDCGSCTVLVDSVPVASCLMPVAQVGERAVATVEGLGGEGDLHPLQEAFRNNNASQCGFCIPGILMAATAFLDRAEPPSRAEVVDGLSGNLCRCTGYESIVSAIVEAHTLNREA